MRSADLRPRPVWTELDDLSWEAYHREEPVLLPKHVVRHVVWHALDDPSYEVCGMIAGDPDPVDAYRVTNADRSAGTSYDMDPDEQAARILEIERAGLQLVGTYHSHPDMEAVASVIDLEEARSWPDLIYVIVGLRPLIQVRAWDLSDELAPRERRVEMVP